MRRERRSGAFFPRHGSLTATLLLLGLLLGLLLVPGAPAVAAVVAGSERSAPAIATPERSGGRALLALPEADHEPDEVRRVTREVLERAEFDQLRPGPVDRVVRWLRTGAGRLLGLLLNSGGAGAVGWAVVGLATLLTLVLLARFSRQLTRDASHHDPLAVHQGRSAQDWRDAAAAHERDQEWRAAVRSRYRAIIADLDRLGVVEEVPGTTVGEYRSAVRIGAPALVAPFGSASDVFEAVWYASAPAGPDEVATLKREGERIAAPAVVS